MKQNITNANPSSQCRDLQQDSSLTEIPELSLDLDGLKSIICHPDNYDFLVKALEKFSPKISDFIAFAHPIQIITDVNVSKCSDKPLIKNGKQVWKRTAFMPDSRFVEWVDDLENPSSWQIYFGLVEIAYEPMFYASSMGQTWSRDNKPALPRKPTARRISYSAKMKELK